MLVYAVLIRLEREPPLLGLFDSWDATKRKTKNKIRHQEIENNIKLSRDGAGKRAPHEWKHLSLADLCLRLF